MKRVVIVILVVAFSVPCFTRDATIASSFGEKALSPIRGSLTVTGTVSWREGVKLPGMAVLHVEIIDASEKNFQTAIVGADSIWPVAVSPENFRIVYDPLKVDPGHVYIVRVRIMDGEKLLFINNMSYRVLTQGASNVVHINVIPVRVR